MPFFANLADRLRNSHKDMLVKDFSVNDVALPPCEDPTYTGGVHAVCLSFLETPHSGPEEAAPPHQHILDREKWCQNLVATFNKPPKTPTLDESCRASRQDLVDCLQTFGYRVGQVDHDVVKVEREMQITSYNKKRALIYALERWIKKNGGTTLEFGRKLFIIFFDGHGGLGRNDDLQITEEHHNYVRLECSGDSADWPKFYMTELQQLLRDRFTSADFLLVLNCCHASEDGLIPSPLPSDSKQHDLHTMETITSTAGGDMYIPGQPQNLITRFSNALTQAGPGVTVKEIFDRMKTLDSRVGPYEKLAFPEPQYRRDCGRKSIVLQSVMRPETTTAAKTEDRDMMQDLAFTPAAHKKRMEDEATARKKMEEDEELENARAMDGRDSFGRFYCLQRHCGNTLHPCCEATQGYCSDCMDEFQMEGDHQQRIYCDHD